MTMISYAQNYEDVMLMRALDNVERGFYIDVGAQDPVEDSVTKAFYERGWNGINIEPVERWYERLCEDRARDVNLRLLAAARAGSVDFYEVADTGLSTMDAALAAQHKREGRHVVRQRVECATLDSILEQHAGAEIHFLKIDVEGAEAEVLRGLSLGRFRPWILVVEARAPNSDIETHDAWEGGVTAAGYRLAYQDGLNRFYVAEEHRSLAKAFAAPPNVLDDFIRHGEWRVRHELQREKVASADQLRRIDILDATLAQRDEQIAQWGARAAELSARLDALQRTLDGREAERESLLERLSDLDGRLEATQRLADGRERELIGLRQHLMQVDAALVTQLQELALRDAQLAEQHAQLVLARVEQTLTVSALQHAESQLALILRSRSWRITRPLRVLNRLIRQGPDELISAIGKHIPQGPLRNFLRALLAPTGLRKPHASEPVPASENHAQAPEALPPGPEALSSRAARALAAMDSVRGAPGDVERQ